MNSSVSFSALKFIRRLKLTPSCVRHCRFHFLLQKKFCTGPDDEYFSDESKKKPHKIDQKSLKQHVTDMYTGDSETTGGMFPSDEVSLKKNTSKSSPVEKKRAGIDPSLTSVLMFPGQGSHFVGMGKKLVHIPNAKDVYERASGVLGYDLLELCLKGPDSKLSKTEFSQPAIVVTSLAAVEKLREENPEAVDFCIAAAGFSVGEITALMFAEALSFEDGIKLIKVRAEAMQRSSEEVSSGMMTAIYDCNSYLKEAMLSAKEYCKAKVTIENPVCEIASFLGTERKVVAGHTEALDFLVQTQEDFGIRHFKRLNVSGAFHTSLMREASVEVDNVLNDMKLKKGNVPVYSNVTSNPYPGNIKRAKTLISEQMVQPIKWEQTIRKIYSRPQGRAYPKTYEVGPRRTLGHLLKATERTAFRSYKAVDV